MIYQINLISFAVSYGFVFSIFEIETLDNNTALFQIGWNSIHNNFYMDLFFVGFIYRRFFNE